MKRKIFGFLILLLSSAVLSTACQPSPDAFVSEGPDTKADPVPAEESTVSQGDNLSEGLDYGGYEYRIYTREV